MERCNEDVCITCSDQGDPVRIVRLLENGMALGENDTEICLDLVEASPGDIVLVHAGVAIAQVQPLA